VPGCKLWLDSSDQSTLYKDSGFTQPATSDGDRIGGWKDKSGNSLNVTQATLANEPTYRVNSLYGLPTLAFTDLSQTVLRSPTGNTTGITGNADRTIFAVWTNWVDNNQAYQHVFHMGTNVNWGTYGIGAEVGGANPRKIGNHYWAANYQATGSAAIPTANPTLAMAYYTGATNTDTWFINGISGGSNVPAATLVTGANDLSVGARIAAGVACLRRLTRTVPP